MGAVQRPLLLLQAETHHGHIIHLHAEKNQKYCKIETTTRSCQPPKAASRAFALSLHPAAFHVPYAHSPLGVMCPLRQGENFRALILLPVHEAPTLAAGRICEPRLGYLVPLGHRCCSGSQHCGTSLGSMGVKLRDAEMDLPHTLPSLWHQGTPPTSLHSCTVLTSPSHPNPLHLWLRTPLQRK